MAATEGADNDAVSTIIVPTVIMAMLFLGNAVVLYVLFRLRKRNKEKCAQDEERAAIVKNNGSAKDVKVEESEHAVEEIQTDLSATIPNGTEHTVEDARC